MPIYYQYSWDPVLHSHLHSETSTGSQRLCIRGEVYPDGCFLMWEVGIKTLGIYSWYHGLMVGLSMESWEWQAEYSVIYENEMRLEDDGLRIGGKVSGEEDKVWKSLLGLNMKVCAVFWSRERLLCTEQHWPGVAHAHAGQVYCGQRWKNQEQPLERAVRLKELEPFGQSCIWATAVQSMINKTKVTKVFFQCLFSVTIMKCDYI